ncbi:outer membrane lipoprotein-sorting protein [Flavihumibacter fluvii]|uniref:outer membrane lipoprotein-sorting protein n=1 Tax=Flavihumibacter fluvii TaxID=2838157 RepID=UPI001BDE1045|nr:outer membrane lipoprotein-sorting protein [Flavihumibacter fluvii]ULQ50989.1 outer membrane lipoprotein-sorting protein [Flavihumibacter fluvii]
MKSMKLAFLGAALLGAVCTYAQTADEVVDKYLNAIGGKENWKKVNSVITEGAMQVQGADVTVVSTAVQGKGSRQDISVMGMTGYQIITPTEGWSYMPFQGQTKAEPATAEMVKMGADQLDVQGALVDYKTKGHSIELLGKEDVDGTECHKLKITYKSGKIDTYFIDPATYLLVKSISKQSINGQEMELTSAFSNYQKTPEGIMIPMAVTVPLGPGLSADMTVKKIEINKPVADTTFKPSN